MRKAKIPEEPIGVGSLFIFKSHNHYDIIFIVKEYMGAATKGKGKKKEGLRVSVVHIELYQGGSTWSTYKDYALSTFRLHLTNYRRKVEEVSLEESKLTILVQQGKSINQLIREALEARKQHKVSNCNWYQGKILEEQENIKELERFQKEWENE